MIQDHQIYKQSRKNFYQKRQIKHSLRDISFNDQNSQTSHKLDTSLVLKISQQHQEQKKIDFNLYLPYILRIQRNYRKFKKYQQKKSQESYEKIIIEAYQNEIKYCQYLKIIIEKILRKSDDLLNYQEKQIIFSNIEQIYDLNQQFLKLFSQRIHRKITVDKFYEDWLELSHYFQIYFQYINDQPQGQLLREDMQKNGNKFIKYFEQYNDSEEFMNQNMESLLIKPLQKLISYELLLKSMLKKLNKKSESYNNVKKLHDQFRDLNNKCNDQIIQQQTQQELGYLQNKFNQEEILIPSRQFLQKDEVLIVNGINQMLVNLYVCSDCLIVIQNEDQSKKTDEKFKFLLNYDINSFVVQQKEKKYLQNAFQICTGQGCYMFSCHSQHRQKDLLDTIQNTIIKYIKNIQCFVFQINKKFTDPIVKQIQEKYPNINLIQPNRQFVFNQEIIYALKDKYYCAMCYFFQDILILFEPDQNLEIIKIFHLGDNSCIINHCITDEVYSFQIKTLKSQLTIISSTIQNQLDLMKKIQNDVIKFIRKSNMVVSLRGTIVRNNQLYYQIVFQQNHNFQILFFTFEQIKDIHKQYTKKYPQMQLPDLGKDSQYEWSQRLLDQDRKIKFQALFQFILTHELSIKDSSFLLYLTSLNKQFYQKQFIYDEQIEQLSFSLNINSFGIQNIKFQQFNDDFRIFSNIPNQQEQYSQEKIYLINDEFIIVDIYQNTSVLNVIQQFGLQKDLQSFLDFKLYMKFKQNNYLYQLDYDEKIETLLTYTNQPFQFYIQKYLFLPNELEKLDFIDNKEKLDIILIQIHYNVMNLNYKLSYEQFINYSALQIYVKYFMLSNFQIDDNFLYKVIQEFIPKKIYQQKDKLYWKNYIVQILKHLKQKYESQDFNIKNESPEKQTEIDKKKPKKTKTRVERRSKSNLKQIFSNIVSILNPNKDNNLNSKDIKQQKRRKSQSKDDTQINSKKNQTQFEIQKQIFKEISRTEYYGYSHYQFKLDKSLLYFKIPSYDKDDILLSIGFQNILLLSTNYERLKEIQYSSITSFFHDYNYIMIEFKQKQNENIVKQTVKLDSKDFLPDTQEPARLCLDYIKVREIIHKHRNQFTN